MDDDALSFIAQASGGDARRALNLLEAAAADAEGARDRRIEVGRLRDLLQRKVLLYDKAGEEHYNLISALHKSMRESDPDATIYWLVRMLEAGEDPLYVARRIVRFASEDIGLADPRALRVALDAKEAFEFLGMPEGSLALVESAVYCAMAPKSNALYEAEGEVKRDVAEKPAEPVPQVIRNAVTKLMKDVGYGQGLSLCAGRARGRRRHRMPSGRPARAPLLPSARFGRGGRAVPAARGGPQAAAGEVGAGGGGREREAEEEAVGAAARPARSSSPASGSSALPS